MINEIKLLILSISFTPFLCISIEFANIDTIKNNLDILKDILEKSRLLTCFYLYNYC